jgi:uncharacterized protein (DUF362 family)
MGKRVFLRKIGGEGVQTIIQESLDWLGCGPNIKTGTRVFLKPNFTYPFHKKGVTTSPEVLEALVAVLTEIGSKIWIGESDGGSDSWRAEEAFVGHRIPEICARYGAQAVNLSRLPRELAETDVVGRKVQVELPSMLLDEVDVFITVPVPKVHVMTGVSLGFKNQWGCIPDVKRLRYHPNFDRVVLAINKLLKPKLAVFDGAYFLNRTGPMDGEAIRKDLLIVSDDVGAGSLVCCEIMGIDARRIRHLGLAMQERMMPEDLNQVRLNTAIQAFKDQHFTLKRTWLNWIALALFHSRLLTWLFYESRLARPAHQVLYLIRGAPKDFSPQW